MKISIEFDEKENFHPGLLPALYEAIKQAFAALGGRAGPMLIELGLKDEK